MNDALAYTLHLFTPVKYGNAYVGNVKRRIDNWRRSNSDRNGYKIGTGDYLGTPIEKLDFFKYYLGYEIREHSVGGLETWRGLITDMELSLNGVKWQRSLGQVSNWVKSIYSSIGTNLLTNGGGESGLWAAFGTPPVRSQSSAWFTEGTVSIHIVGDSDGDGAYVQQGVPIVAAIAYQMRLSVNIVSGTWRLKIVRAADHTQELAKVEISGAGEGIMQATIAETNSYSGNVDIFVRLVGSSGEAYFDAGVFQVAPLRAETTIHQDTTSQGVYGRLETILMRPGMTTQAANDDAETYLQRHLWARSFAPGDLLSLSEAEDVTLALTLCGYSSTLNYRYVVNPTSTTRTAQVTALVGASEFVTAGVIENNANTYQVDDTAPLRVGDTLQAIADAGDSAGNRWQIGVWQNRQLNYQVAPQAIQYRLRRGRLLYATGGEVPLWHVKPGYVFLDDAPVGFSSSASNILNEPRVMYVDEFEWQAPDQFSWHRLEDTQ